jgi:hypothetical protein
VREYRAPGSAKGLSGNRRSDLNGNTYETPDSRYTANRSEFDILTVKGKKAEEEFDLCFNINIPKGWLNRHMTDKERVPNKRPEGTPGKSSPSDPSQMPGAPHP